MFCKVTLIGRICTDISQVNGGIKFSVAYKGTKRGEDGLYISEFIDCLCFGETAKNLTQYISKGDLLYIEGTLTQGEYVNQQGQKIKTISVFVGMFKQLSKKQQSGQVGQYEQVNANAYKKQSYAKSYAKKAPAQNKVSEAEVFGNDNSQMPF